MPKRRVRIVAMVVGIVLVILLYSLIFSGILVERQRQASLEEQLAMLGMASNQQPGEARALQIRQVELGFFQMEQATAEAELAAARLAFPSEVDSTEVLAHVIATAASHDANLRQVQAREPSTVTVDADTYRLFSYDVQVEGELNTLTAFFTALENGPVDTLSLDQIQLQAVPTATAVPATSHTPPLATATPASFPYQASLVIHVYARLAGPDTTPVPSSLGTPDSEEQVQQLQGLLEQARRSGDWERAISLLLALRQLDPANASLVDQLVQAYLRAGQRRLEAGQYEQARIDFQEALALQPDNSQALDGLAALTPTTVSPPTSTVPITSTPTAASLRGPRSALTNRSSSPPYSVQHLTLSANDRYPELGCQWFGFAGRVIDASGAPVGGMTVRIWADGWEGASAVTAAGGEYELFMNDQPLQAQWQVQLVQGETAVSEVVTVESQADCDATLIHMDWQQGDQGV